MPDAELLLKTITGPQLMDQRLQEPPQVIPGLLVEGLTIFAGKSKLGKSYMALNWCLAVASGGYALGKIKVDQSTALYLGLEDSLSRLQLRLAQMSETIPETLHLAPVSSLPRLDNGGLGALDEWLSYHSDCRLVIIDTLGRVRPPKSQHGDSYEDDTAIGSALQALALKHHIALVVVTHTRKMYAEDPSDMIIGGVGLPAAADSAIVLQKQREASSATLAVWGREVSYQSIDVSFDISDGLWYTRAELEDTSMSQERREVWAYLLRKGGSTPKEIAEGIATGRGAVRRLLIKMRNAGQLESNNGYYYIIDGNNGNSTAETPSQTGQNPVTAPVTEVASAQGPVTSGNKPVTGINAVQDDKNDELLPVTELKEFLYDRLRMLLEYKVLTMNNSAELLERYKLAEQGDAEARAAIEEYLENSEVQQRLMEGLS